MPIYEYVCLKCKKEHEVMQKFSDTPLATCQECGGEMRKLISSSSFVLKGTGWYKTDYGTEKKDKTKELPKEKSDKKSSESTAKKSEPVSA